MLSKCPTCHSRRVTALSKTKHGTLISGCKRCGLVFVNPPPSKEENEARYRPGGEWEQRYANRPADEVRSADKAVLNIAAQLYSSGPCFRRALDFGCGQGEILDALNDAGWITTGIDPYTKGTITRHRMLDEMPSRPEFDFIIMKHVIEHLIDPLAILKQARACLRDDGYLFIGTPTLDGLREHGKKNYCINTTHHITAYTAQSLSNLLAMAGFETVLDMPRKVPSRMSFLAKTAKPKRRWWPLRDARMELSRYQ